MTLIEQQFQALADEQNKPDSITIPRLEYNLIKAYLRQLIAAFTAIEKAEMAEPPLKLLQMLERCERRG